VATLVLSLDEAAGPYFFLLANLKFEGSGAVIVRLDLTHDLLSYKGLPGAVCKVVARLMHILSITYK
jgi:hypothetical protein